MTRFLPITPTLCLPVRYADRSLDAPKGMVTWATVNERGAKLINKLVARCAEDLVFSSAQSASIESLVRNCANFRVEAEFIQLAADEPDAVYDGTIIRVRDMGKAAYTKRQRRNAST
jgi:hypothetical protein